MTGSQQNELPAGSIDWGYYADKPRPNASSSAAQGRATKLLAASSKTIPQQHGQTVASHAADTQPPEMGAAPAATGARWTGRVMLCTFVGALLFAVNLFTTATTAPTTNSIARISVPCKMPNLLQQDAADLLRCLTTLNEVNDTEVREATSVSNLATSVAVGYNQTIELINERVVPAGVALQSATETENCDAINKFWNTLNATRNTASSAGRHSQDLVAALLRIGTAMDDRLVEHNVSQSMLGDTFLGRVFARRFEFSLDRNSFGLSRQKDQYSIKGDCRTVQTRLLILAHDYENRLVVFVDGATQWSAQPGRWLGTCTVEDDRGGMEGLWALVQRDALAVCGGAA